MKQPEPFGKFLLYGQVAVGGMAEIYKARYADPSMPQYDIALKRILPSYTEDESFVTMFKDEGEIAMRLKHPNIVNVFEVGEVNNDWYIAMEFINGTDIRVLSDACEKYNKRFTPTQVARIVCETAKALYYAHTATAADGTPLNIVHRDCTPHNIMVSEQGQVKLMDFGIAKAASRATKTRVGTVKGKSAYMSPEQARGKVLDGRSDMFTLGTVGWELLTGYRLFKANSDFEILTKVLKSEIIHPSELDSNVPRGLGDIMMVTLKRDRDTRYPDCQALADDLENWIRGNGDGSDQNLGAILLALTNKQGHSYAELPDYVPGASNYDYVDGDFKLKVGANLGGGGMGMAPAPAPAPAMPAPGPQPAMPAAPMASQPMMAAAPQAAMPYAQQTISGFADPVNPEVSNKLPLGYIIGYVALFAATVICAVFAFKQGSGEEIKMPKFSPPETFITIKSRPNEAKVLVNGIPLRDENGKEQLTPVYSYRSRLGNKMTLTFEKEGYESLTVERDIVLPSQEIDVSMLTTEEAIIKNLNALPELTIMTDPPGIVLTVNGEKKGESPVVLKEVPFGNELKVEATAEGYDDVSETIVISKTMDKEYEIKLQKAEGKNAPAVADKKAESGGMGEISIVAQPWAIVKVNNKNEGMAYPPPKKPLVIPIKSGNHKVELRCSGSATASKKVTVTAGKTVKLTYDCTGKSWKN